MSAFMESIFERAAGSGAEYLTNTSDVGSKVGKGGGSMRNGESISSDAGVFLPALAKSTNQFAPRPFI
jgi:hypothetical protein